MINERFKIFIEQLRDGHVEKLDEDFSPDIIDIHEKDLAFADPVNVKGEAYLANEMLVLHLDLRTIATISCAICNEPVKIKIDLKGCYHAIPIDEIKGSVFNIQDTIRESILLETPTLVECEGKCPQRQVLKQYLKESTSKAKEENEEGYRPFADLDFDENKKKKSK